MTEPIRADAQPTDRELAERIMRMYSRKSGWSGEVAEARIAELIAQHQAGERERITRLEKWDTRIFYEVSLEREHSEDAMQEREKFEAIATREGWLHSDWKLMRMDGLPVRYLDANLQKRWEGWQARAALVDGPGSNTFTGHDGGLYALGTSGSVAHREARQDASEQERELRKSLEAERHHVGRLNTLIVELRTRESAWWARMTRLSFEVTGNDYALEKMTPDEVTKAFQDYRERAIEDAETCSFSGPQRIPADHLRDTTKQF